ncbi:kunitz-type protease inhibitor 2 [Leuresthes tenuis]|uniref:kunitz-type protease inhibitor 2 n=1 Tax=Leuresthes tenuis TaxID=355514 RepID=UPI003B514FD3
MKFRMIAALLAFLFLVQSGPAQSCDWDQSTDPNQGLDPASLKAGARFLHLSTEVPDAEGCRSACCEDPACDLALVGFPADGGPQCSLVSCASSGRDACELRRSPQFQVFRRKVSRAPHIQPLLGAWEPRSNDSNKIHCRLPMKVGSCRAAFPKFFYNVTNQSCDSFIYGGCAANGNNFDSQEECEAACSGVTGSVLPDDSTPAPPQPAAKAPRMAPEGPAESDLAESAPTQRTGTTSLTHWSIMPDHCLCWENLLEELCSTPSRHAFVQLERCEAAPKAGPCRASLKHWFYNQETGSCQSFIYGGCRGNKNNYLSEDSCRATCTGVTVLPSSKKASAKDGGPASSTAHCRLSPDSGPCRAAFTKFFYDSDSASCHTFLFGGCRGNANKFDSKEACMRSCGGEGTFDGRGVTRSRWTAAFFLFLTLAGISVLLLAALVITTLRRHRLSRRTSSVSDKEELLPEPDELSSVDSLTMPEKPTAEPEA